VKRLIKLFFIIPAIFAVVNFSTAYAAEWADIGGKITTEDGTPLCAMVLANGQYMFTCDPEGEYELSVPLDENKEITLFAFCDGLAPFKEILTAKEASNFNISMLPVSSDSGTMTVTAESDIADSNSELVKINGTVKNGEGNPLCAMVLANGQHIFTCGDTEGKYELEVPPDENGEITIFAFCDGFQPFKKVISAPVSENTQIKFNGKSITVSGSGATASGSKLTVTSAGTYSISGSLTDGQIIVNTLDEEAVELILNGVSITNSSGSAINIISAKETVIVLADNTENYVTDGSSYVFEDTTSDEPNAAIFSKDDLTISGSGSLTVKGNYNDGIACKDGIIITGGNITVNAVDDGIRGKNYIIVKDGDIAVNAKGNGLKSDNEEDTTMGYISVDAGIINITSTGDAVTAQTDIKISGGAFTLTSGGGSSASFNESISAKGIKAVAGVTVDGGTFSVSSADDALHSNGSIIINSGSFTLASGDDGIHADSSVEINGGEISITKSYEGIEGAVITINEGDIQIVSSDDGLNVAGGNDGSGINRPGGGGFNPSGNYWLYINGGYIVINAVGDGIDINGSIEMTDGALIVNGPTSNANGALDYDASFKISGGFFAAAGSSGMAQAPGTTSSQNSIMLTFKSSQKAGSLVHIQTTGGEGILTFAPSKAYQSIVLSSPDLIKGSSYDVYLGGSSTGTVTDGLYLNGTYTPGTKNTTFTVSGVVTRATGF